VLTNAHVIEGPTISVTLSTSWIRGRGSSGGTQLDLAVLKVRRAGLTTAKVGRAADLQVGTGDRDGSPFGFKLGHHRDRVGAAPVVKVPDDEGGGEGGELVGASRPTPPSTRATRGAGQRERRGGRDLTAIATNGAGEDQRRGRFAIPIDEALGGQVAGQRRPVDVPFLGWRRTPS
jgi:hypothetical protein